MSSATRPPHLLYVIRTCRGMASHEHINVIQNSLLKARGRVDKHLRKRQVHRAFLEGARHIGHAKGKGRAANRNLEILLQIFAFLFDGVASQIVKETRFLRIEAGLVSVSLCGSFAWS